MLIFRQSAKPLFTNNCLQANTCLLRFQADDSTVYYQLSRLKDDVYEEVRNTLQSWGAHEYALFKMRGKTLPDYDFTDLNGQHYNKQNTAGKVLVIKCWFVNCAPCIKEMPLLNQIVQRFKNSKDVVFVSLALDDRKALDNFLKKTAFEYPVVPEQEAFISEKLMINAFPTHLVINKKGVVTMVSNEYKAMEYALEKVVAAQ